MIALLFAIAAQAAAATSTPPSAVAAAAVPVPVPVLAPIGRQTLPARGCAAFLWSAGGDRQLVAMVVADPPTIRLAPGGRTIDLPRTAAEGLVNRGFAASAEYRGGDMMVALDMEMAQPAGLTAGAQVPTGLLRVDQAGRDTLLLPIAGLVGCSGRAG